MKYNYIFVSFIFLSLCLSSIHAQEKTDKSITNNLLVTTGFGVGYGNTAFPNLGLEYEYRILHNQHLGIHAGGGHDFDYNVWAWAAGLRYSFGIKDRFYINALYGVNSYAEVSKDNSDEFYLDEVYYEPGLILGYRRVTKEGLVVTVGAGFCYAEESLSEFWFISMLNFEVSLGYRVF